MTNRISSWFSRTVLLAALIILTLIGRKYVGDPFGAAAASDMTLDSPLAVTNMRASFGAFPLGCALFVLLCLVTSSLRRTGLCSLLSSSARCSASACSGSWLTALSPTACVF
jgi:hypothetical protein